MKYATYVALTKNNNLYWFVQHVVKKFAILIVMNNSKILKFQIMTGIATHVENKLNNDYYYKTRRIESI